tara:strand:+ start:2741 stop:3523 length:783 start_codon:yes stop_codon:yes gene_type:complete
MGFIDDVAGGGYSPFNADRMINKQRDSLEAGTAGMSEAEKNQRKAKATEAAGQQVGAMQQDLSQQALASGGMGQGANTKAMLQLGGAAAEAGAGASEQIEAQSAEIAEAKRQETLAHYQQSKQNKMELMNSAVSKLTGPSLEGAGDALLRAADPKKEGGSGLASRAVTAGLSLLPLMLCWVAREVVPNEWRDARTYILFQAPAWFRKLYLQHGEKTALWIAKHPRAKPVLRPLFRYFARRGRAFQEVNPQWVATANTYFL